MACSGEITSRVSKPPRWKKKSQSPFVYPERRRLLRCASNLVRPRPDSASSSASPSRTQTVLCAFCNGRRFVLPFCAHHRAQSLPKSAKLHPIKAKQSSPQRFEYWLGPQGKLHNGGANLGRLWAFHSASFKCLLWLVWLLKSRVATIGERDFLRPLWIIYWWSRVCLRFFNVQCKWYLFSSSSSNEIVPLVNVKLCNAQ